MVDLSPGGVVLGRVVVTKSCHVTSEQRLSAGSKVNEKLRNETSSSSSSTTSGWKNGSSGRKIKNEMELGAAAADGVRLNHRLVKIWANSGLYFVYFHPYLIQIKISAMQLEISVDGVLGIWTRGCKMVDADETTEVWRPSPSHRIVYPASFLFIFVLFSIPWQMTINGKRVDGVLGIRTRDYNMEGSDEFTGGPQIIDFTIKFKKWAIHGLFFIYFRSVQQTNGKFYSK